MEFGKLWAKLHGTEVVSDFFAANNRLSDGASELTIVASCWELTPIPTPIGRLRDPCYDLIAE